MAPDRYTELFFLDEATGFAAGHRPCAECRHGRYIAFRNPWTAGNPHFVASGRVSADELDTQLHAERLGPARSKRTFRAKLDELPDGVFVTRSGGERANLLWRGRLLQWSPARYQQLQVRRGAEEVAVLTPQSTVAAIRAGYVPDVHPSAERIIASVNGPAGAL
jgi:hypothetical protein